MLMTIQYQDGLIVEAVVLAASTERMRVAIASQRDTVELHKVDTSWYADTGIAIEIGSLIPIPGTKLEHFNAAGQAFVAA
jgi:hypothetical protein